MDGDGYLRLGIGVGVGVDFVVCGELPAISTTSDADTNTIYII